MIYNNPKFLFTSFIQIVNQELLCQASFQVTVFLLYEHDSIKNSHLTAYLQNNLIN